MLLWKDSRGVVLLSTCVGASGLAASRTEICLLFCLLRVSVFVPKNRPLGNCRKRIRRPAISFGNAIHLLHIAQKGQKESFPFAGPRDADSHASLWRLHRIHTAAQPREVREKNVRLTLDQRY